MRVTRRFATLGLAGTLALPVMAGAATNDTSARLQALEEGMGHLEARLRRQMNELQWFQRLSDVAVVDTARFTGPPPRATNNPAPPAGSNEVVVSALTFLPRKGSPGNKLPLIVLAQGEIHGNVASDEEAHVVRELVEQGYAVIAPDYRGTAAVMGEISGGRLIMAGWKPRTWRRRDGGCWNATVRQTHGGWASLAGATAG